MIVDYSRQLATNHACLPNILLTYYGINQIADNFDDSWLLKP